MKTLTLIALFALAAPAIANPNLTPSGTPVVVNGKTFYKQAAKPTQQNGVNTRSARSLNAGLARGDVLLAQGELVASTVNGNVLLRLAKPADEAAVLKTYGFTIKHRSGGILLLAAPAGADLQQLQTRLATDSRIQQAQLELVTPDAQPQ